MLLQRYAVMHDHYVFNNRIVREGELEEGGLDWDWSLGVNRSGLYARAHPHPVWHLYKPGAAFFQSARYLQVPNFRIAYFHSL